MTEVHHDTLNILSASHKQPLLNIPARRGQRVARNQAGMLKKINVDRQEADPPPPQFILLIISVGFMKMQPNIPRYTLYAPPTPPPITDNQPPSNNRQGEGFLKFPLRSVIASPKAVTVPT